MVTTLLLGMLGFAHAAPMFSVSGNMVWEEYAVVQQIPGYHPKLRFKPESKFIFETPYYKAEGKYSVQDGHYHFHPLMAMQLENADVDKLVADLDPQTKSKLHKMYAESLNDFDADYYDATSTLSLDYPVKGNIESFALHAYTEGDNLLEAAGGGLEPSMVGLWNAPEPFPEMLDARTRYKIGGLEGLERFSHEASASDDAQFALLDLRKDKSYRFHGKLGTWYVTGSTLVLVDGNKETPYAISEDRRKLSARGKIQFIIG